MLCIVSPNSVLVVFMRVSPFAVILTAISVIVGETAVVNSEMETLTLHSKCSDAFVKRLNGIISGPGYEAPPATENLPHLGPQEVDLKSKELVTACVGRISKDKKKIKPHLRYIDEADAAAIIETIHKVLKLDIQRGTRLAERIYRTMPMESLRFVKLLFEADTSKPSLDEHHPVFVKSLGDWCTTPADNRLVESLATAPPSDMASKLGKNYLAPLIHYLYATSRCDVDSFEKLNISNDSWSVHRRKEIDLTTDTLFKETYPVVGSPEEQESDTVDSSRRELPLEENHNLVPHNELTEDILDHVTKSEESPRTNIEHALAVGSIAKNTLDFVSQVGIASDALSQVGVKSVAAAVQVDLVNAYIDLIQRAMTQLDVIEATLAKVQEDQALVFKVIQAL